MAFKRSMLRYGETTQPVTPYQKAAQKWDERIGSARVQAHNWRLMALGSVLLSVILAAILLWLGRSGGAVPYIVEVDRQGALGRKPVGDPYLGLRPSQEGRNHRLATTGRDDMGDGCRAAEPPLPHGLLPPQQAATAMGFSLHTCRSLVAGDDGAARTSAAMASPATAKGLAARAGMMAMAPSGSVRPNSPLQHLDQLVVADQIGRHADRRRGPRCLGLMPPRQAATAMAERAAVRHIGGRGRRRACRSTERLRDAD